jgi:hypothetical protein
MPAAALLLVGQLELGLVVELQRSSLARDFRSPEQFDVGRLHVVEVEQQLQLEHVEPEQLQQFDQLQQPAIAHVELLGLVELLQLVELECRARRLRLDRELLGQLSIVTRGLARRRNFTGTA